MSSAVVIEADEAFAQSVVSALKREGIQVFYTGDGQDGLRLIAKQQPDVVILSVELPGVSGYSICTKLKKHPQLSKVPLILTSSQATDETFAQHKKLRTRADAYLRKPCSADDVLAAAAQWLDIGDEVEVSLDDVDEDVQVEVPGSATGFEAESTTMMSAKDIARMREEAKKRAAERAAPAAASGPASQAVSAQAQQETQRLRQKVQSLERALEDKEIEFNDRLLKESDRGREVVEVKKKVALLERESQKYQDQFAGAQARIEELEVELKETLSRSSTAQAGRSAVEEKLEQVVTKFKEVKAERDGLRTQVESSSSSQGELNSQVEQAQKVKEKARKAVDIALQLIDETGLVHG